MMKKLLILGGTAQQIKLVEAAKKMGVYTIVTDYLVDSPAKKVADEAWMLNIKDVDQIVERCKQEQVNGVICGYIDPCQRPYQQICEALDSRKCAWRTVLMLFQSIQKKKPYPDRRNFHCSLSLLTAEDRVDSLCVTLQNNLKMQ